MHLGLKLPSVGAIPAFCDVRDEDCTCLAHILFRQSDQSALVIMIDRDQGATVTNGAEKLCEAVATLLRTAYQIQPQNIEWIYRDTMGLWDKILPKIDERLHCLNVRFAPLGNRSPGACSEYAKRFGSPDEIQELLSLPEFS